MCAAVSLDAGDHEDIEEMFAFEGVSPETEVDALSEVQAVSRDPQQNAAISVSTVQLFRPGLSVWHP